MGISLEDHCDWLGKGLSDWMDQLVLVRTKLNSRNIKNYRRRRIIIIIVSMVTVMLGGRAMRGKAGAKLSATHNL